MSTKNSRPADTDVKKEVEAQTKEIEKKLLQAHQAKLKAFEKLDGFHQAALLALPIFKEGAFLEKFKALDFEKYDRIDYPKLHTLLYICKMG